jgi:hypothetical protein
VAVFDDWRIEDLTRGQAQSVLETGAGGLDAGGLAASFMSGNWIGAGLQLLGGMLQGKTDISQAGAGGAGALNTSGWVVGEGDATGGSLSDSSGGGLGWQGWALLTVVAVIMIKRMD